MLGAIGAAKLVALKQKRIETSLRKETSQTRKCGGAVTSYTRRKDDICLSFKANVAGIFNA